MKQFTWNLLNTSKEPWTPWRTRKDRSITRSNEGEKQKKKKRVNRMRPHPGEGNEEDERLPHKGRPHTSGRTHWNRKGPSGAIKRKCSGWSVAGRTEQDLHGWSVPQALHAPAWDGCPPVQMGAGCWSVGLGEWTWIEDNCLAAQRWPERTEVRRKAVWRQPEGMGWSTPQSGNSWRKCGLTWKWDATVEWGTNSRATIVTSLSTCQPLPLWELGGIPNRASVCTPILAMLSSLSKYISLSQFLPLHPLTWARKRHLRVAHT